MSFQAVQLKRGLFGYRPQSVRQILEDRDTMFRVAEGRVEAAEAGKLEADVELAAVRAELQQRAEQAEAAWAAQAKVDQAEVELAAARAELQQRAEQAEAAEHRIREVEAELAAARAELQQRAEQAAEGQVPARDGSGGVLDGSSAEDLSTVLDTAQQAITQIIDRARRSSEEQLLKTERMREDVRAEIERLVAWRDQFQPMIRGVLASAEEAQTSIAQVPDRIRDALAPMTDALRAVKDSFSELADAPISPAAAGSDGSDHATTQGHLIEIGEIERVMLEADVPEAPGSPSATNEGGPEEEAPAEAGRSEDHFEEAEAESPPTRENWWISYTKRR